MTRDDIIRMAREQGMPETATEGVFIVNSDDLGRMLAAEREACARVCENMTLEWEDQPAIAQAELATLKDCALAIRSRSN